LEPFLWVDRRQLVERLHLQIIIRGHAVDIEQLLQARTLAPAMPLHHACQQHAFAQPELLDHRAGHKRIRALPREVRIRIAEEPVAVGVHFQYARPGHQRQRFAVIATAFVVLSMISILAIVVLPVRTPPAAATRATSAAASTAAASTSVVSVLAVIAVTTASTTSAPAAPTLFLGHVTQTFN